MRKMSMATEVSVKFHITQRVDIYVIFAQAHTCTRMTSMTSYSTICIYVIFMTYICMYVIFAQAATLPKPLSFIKTQRFRTC